MRSVSDSKFQGRCFFFAQAAFLKGFVRAIFKRSPNSVQTQLSEPSSSRSWNMATLAVSAEEEKRTDGCRVTDAGRKEVDAVFVFKLQNKPRGEPCPERPEAS